MNVVVLIGLLVLAPGQVDERITAAHQDGQRCAAAVITGEFELLADLTHPRILENLGDRERMIDIVKRGAGDMKAQGFEFRSCKAEVPKAVVEGGDGLYALIPTTLIVGTPEGAITIRSFLVGYSKNNGKGWVYIDGANGGPAVRELFPETPKELELPERQPPKYDVK